MMAQNRINWRTLGLPVYLALALLVVVGVGFVAALVSLQPEQRGAVGTVSAESYRARVDALLANAHPENAEAALVKYGCVACHRDGALNGIAPIWVGVAYRAAQGRSSLPADLYIYESIVSPSAYVVEGYADVMPQNFGARLSDQELGDIIAYLLTPEAR